MRDYVIALTFHATRSTYATEANGLKRGQGAAHGGDGARALGDQAGQVFLALRHVGGEGTGAEAAPTAEGGGPGRIAVEVLHGVGGAVPASQAGDLDPTWPGARLDQMDSGT